MASVSKTPISRLIQGEEEEKDEKAKSREEYRKLKELKEARKLGNAPAAVDEEGKDINPHIPQYISDAPWYVDPKGPTLKHQRPQEEKVREFSSIKEWYKRGIDPSKITTRYRPGACENCGAVTHKKKDCLERPRKVGAKYTGANFAPDEFVQPKLKHDFDGKRDRWNGYNADSHREVIEEYQKLEEEKKVLKKEKLRMGAGNPEEDDGAPSSDEDEDKYVDKMDMPGTKVDAAERYTVRNLRIREDTAKYLRNLDPNSAHYDPKTRSMRKNPYEGTGKTEEEVDYAGDNFVRITGDTVYHAKSQLFAWEAERKGLDVHALAEPTKLETLRMEYTTKKEDFKDEAKKSIMEKYGGADHLNVPPRELIFSQTEDYVEYSRHGKVLKGEEELIARSKYEEDIHPGNHTSVWGSYWKGGQWGFSCCHSFIKNSYCTGEAGKETSEILAIPSATENVEKEESKEVIESSKVSEESVELDKSEKNKTISSSSSSSSEDSDHERAKRRERRRKRKEKKKKRKRKKKRKEVSSSSSDSSSDEDSREKKIKKAMKKLEEEEKGLVMDDRKRGYNSSLKKQETLKEPDDIEMEAYYRKRQRTEDPMAKYL
ncbi:pre-mRNA-splicing factor SLU7 [Lepeophtheirus salmonis]|uniref:Pre-mRNA-splicing factor SLU7 n=1 Tax=Lepeophtheirus salmonis TaxID=72036 RepID=A0A0K2TQC3_LEPSM|nr:pre-mRNA-splicing factor SLU7-like [Lepeophtheirus salmonis]